MSEPESLDPVPGVSIRSEQLLRLAFAHSSYLNENPDVLPESNERLEFLGDAVVGAAVADELYRRHPGWTEGRLTQARSALVSGDTLAQVAEGLGLGERLLMGEGEESGGGRKRPSNLAAALEALVGALFLDQGYDAAREFVLRVLAQELEDVGRRSRLTNPKSQLQEAVQARGLAPPTYEIVRVTGSAHARTFTAEVLVDGTVVGRGGGNRKSLAEREAAAQALRRLGYDPQPAPGEGREKAPG